MSKSVRKKSQRNKPMPLKQAKLSRVKGSAQIDRVSTSQELAKDPDPLAQDPIEQSDDDRSEEELHWSVSEPVTLETLHDAVRLFGKQGGNEIFNKFLQNNPDKWGLTCGGPTEEFTNFPDKQTWEEACQVVMELAQRPSSLEYYMNKIFSKKFEAELEEMDSDSVDEIWSHRSLFMALAMSDPSQVFSLSKISNVGNARYWDSSDWYNPILQVGEDKPLAIVWLISSHVLGHPWAGPEPPAIEEVFWARQARLQKRVSDLANNRYTPLEIVEAKIMTDNESSSQEKSPSNKSSNTNENEDSSPDTTEAKVMEHDEDEASATSSHSVKGRTLLQSFNKVQNWSSELKKTDAHQSDSDTDMESQDDSHSSASAMDTNGTDADAMAMSGRKKTVRICESQNQSDNEKENESIATSNSNQQKNESCPESEDEGHEERRNQNAAARTYTEAAATSSRNRRLLQGQRYDPLNRTRRPSLAIANPGGQDPRRFMTRDDRVRALIQPRLDGIPRSFVQVFDINMGVTWSSKTEEGTRLDQKITDQVKEHAKELFEEFDDLIILPLQEKKCSDKTKWIENYRKFAKVIKKYNDLRLYCDFNYANASYIQNQSAKPGNKVMRTRIRFAFNLPIDSMRAGISMTLANSGVNGGCFRSATQFGNQVVAGTLFFLPEQIDPNEIERQIMMKMNALCAVGIGEGFVNNPSQRTQKWEGFNLRQWLLYCDLPDVSTVNNFALNWLAPTTPKQDGIYASPITYMSDWHTAKKGFLNIPSFGYLQRSIEDLMVKAKTMELTTRVIECEYDFPGL